MTKAEKKIKVKCVSTPRLTTPGVKYEVGKTYEIVASSLWTFERRGFEQVGEAYYPDVPTDTTPPAADGQTQHDAEED